MFSPLSERSWKRLKSTNSETAYCNLNCAESMVDLTKSHFNGIYTFAFNKSAIYKAKCFDSQIL